MEQDVSQEVLDGALFNFRQKKAEKINSFYVGEGQQREQAELSVYWAQYLSTEGGSGSSYSSGNPWRIAHDRRETPEHRRAAGWAAVFGG